MASLLLTGYRAFELGIFSDKDPKVAVIKKLLKKLLISYCEEGFEWFILTGNLGFEYWALEVLQELKKDYPITIATIFLFENHGQHWNESNQEKLAAFKAVDFVKYSFPSYENPSQFKSYNNFLINHTDEALLFYDPENETHLKYFYQEMLKENYKVSLLDFERLNEYLADVE